MEKKEKRRSRSRSRSAGRKDKDTRRHHDKQDRSKHSERPDKSQFSQDRPNNYNQFHERPEKSQSSHHPSQNNDPKLQQWMGRKEETKSENWNADKISQGDVKTPSYDVLNIIRKERAEDQEKIDRNFAEKGWTKLKVKEPLNIYEKLMNKHIVKPHKPVIPSSLNNPIAPKMIEVIVNDRMGKKERIKCCPQDIVSDFKKLVSAKTGTKPEKIRLQRQHQVLKDHISLEDYEIMHEMQIEMYYN